MSPEDFVQRVRQEIVDDLWRETVEALSEATSAAETSGTLRRYAIIRALYDKLDQETRTSFQLVLRDAIVNAVSSLLALIDGVSFFEENRGNFSLLYEGAHLEGDLCDYFWAMEEEEGWLSNSPPLNDSA